MDGTYITAIRTGGTAAVATRVLAREDAKVLAILGAGAQGGSHLETFPRVRDFEEIRVANRNPDRARELAARNPRARAVASFEEAVRGADVVAAATHSAEPVLQADWVAPGTHVSSVGYNAPGSELDPALVRGATIVVESRDSTFAPPPGGAPELAEVDPASVAELGEIVSGARPGRRTLAEITLYTSVGVAVQDLAAAALVLAEAKARNVGLEIELEEIPA
jgi:ornithine cyclodeaminase/alanine dehydrogenase-like protein (mu-crystallin family)